MGSFQGSKLTAAARKRPVNSGGYLLRQASIYLNAPRVQRDRHFLLIKKELQDAAVEPVFNPKKIGATFYRRADLAKRSG